MQLPDSAAATRLELIAPAGLPEIHAGDDLAALIAAACRRDGIVLADDDVVIVAQKIVSKSEGRRVRLDSVTPGNAALELAARTGKDARLVELILAESRRIVREVPDLIIVEHRQGFVMANAGIDQSNVADGEVLLLPVDVDASAATLHKGLSIHAGASPGVIVSDSVGRPWRLGTVGLALGVAGMPALVDLRGRPDRSGRELRVSETAHADNLASAAMLLMGEAGEGRPVVIARGAAGDAERQSGRALLRDAAKDLFR